MAREWDLRRHLEVGGQKDREVEVSPLELRVREKHE